MASFPERVTRMIVFMPAVTASSTTYWIAGLSTMGSISLGIALEAGSTRVPSPATGMIAVVTEFTISSCLDNKSWYLSTVVKILRLG